MMRKSHLISKGEFERLSAGARILEQDERGIKVLKLENGDILKIFRVRNKLSAARFYSYARRFCRNAERLQRLNIPTVRIKELFHLENSAETAVLYAPLDGKTLRELLDTRALTAGEAKGLGEFFAVLHHDGVHFRSLHPGNIVLDPQAAFGLIDIADMSIYPWPLWCGTRARSFSHIYRYPEYIRKLGSGTWQHIEAAYFSKAALGSACENFLRRHLKLISVFTS
ncbi:hypothetical protein MTYP_00542 [Methylophilaceae bacterium]|nr:hypothetical protein MTYP_00542 [Methylophilaceae bacterium]